jgi:hypothetical protein
MGTSNAILSALQAGHKLSRQLGYLVSGSVIGLVCLAGLPVAPGLAQAPPPPGMGVLGVRYLVIVDSGDVGVLQQVKQVAPDAFIQSFADGRPRIQAGGFNTDIGARDRVNALARIGIPAAAYNERGQIVYSPGTPTNPTNPTPQPPTSGIPGAPSTAAGMPKGYYAIVPIGRDQMGATYDAIRQLGVPERYLNVGEQLNGWHVSVGVYPNRSGAEQMVNYLRSKGGFDARSYYRN